MRSPLGFLAIPAMVLPLLILGACAGKHGGNNTGGGTNAPPGGPTSPTNVYYVATNGNDSTAEAGDASKPWKTIWAAVSNSVPGSLVDISEGTFAVSNSLFLKEGSTLKGKGPDQTSLVFYGQNDPPALPSYFLVPSDNCTISGLLLTNFWSTNWYQTSIGFDIRQGMMRFTNVLVQDCVAYSHTDVLYLTDDVQNDPAIPYYTQMRFEDCRLFSRWDNQTFGIAGAGIDWYPFYNIFYRNCKFANYGTIAPDEYQFGTGIQALLRSSNEPCDPPPCVHVMGTHLTMENCTLQLETTNGTVFFGGVISITNQMTQIWSNQVTNALYLGEIEGFMYGVFFTNGVQKLPVN